MFSVLFKTTHDPESGPQWFHFFAPNPTYEVHARVPFHNKRCHHHHHLKFFGSCWLCPWQSSLFHQSMEVFSLLKCCCFELCFRFFPLHFDWNEFSYHYASRIMTIVYSSQSDRTKSQRFTKKQHRHKFHTWPSKDSIVPTESQKELQYLYSFSGDHDFVFGLDKVQWIFPRKCSVSRDMFYFPLFFHKAEVFCQKMGLFNCLPIPASSHHPSLAVFKERKPAAFYATLFDGR